MPKARPGHAWSNHQPIFPFNELRRREYGFRPSLGWESCVKASMYSCIRSCSAWDPRDDDEKTGFVGHGGVFNLEFSPDGNHLVAACEQKAVMVFDPISRQQTHLIPRAHENCVNCIKFLDSRVFATCSDDHNVALWDVRNLSRRVRLLEGHTNWVKNIEYSASDGILVTSGFDGKVLGWDINSYTEAGVKSEELFCMQGLMRMRLNPDGSKLVVCTTGGYMVLVHDLSLEYLSQDLKGFKPNIYRLMQLSQMPISQAATYTPLFTGTRNRIELVSDFPSDNDAAVIHSLQVHPHGWCVLSRNTSMDEESEWTCVHDIQESVVPAIKEEDEDSSNHVPEVASDEVVEYPAEEEEPIHFEAPVDRFDRGVGGSRGGASPLAVTLGQHRVDIRLHRGMPGVSGGVGDEGGVQVRVTSADMFEVLQQIHAGRESQRLRLRARRGAVRGYAPLASGSMEEPRPLAPGNDSSLNPQHATVDYDPPQTFYIGTGRGNHRAILLLQPGTNYPRRNRPPPTVDPQHRMARNAPRLTNYLEELNVDRGFIKELCFSPDGRLICSPYANGIRLLTFDAECSELSTCLSSTPQRLHEVSQNECHTNCVVSTKFSPTHCCLLVSGCLNGRIVWHQPVL